MLPTGAFMLLPKNRVKISEINKRFNNRIESISSPANLYYTIKPKKHEKFFKNEKYWVQALPKMRNLLSKTFLRVNILST